MIHQFEHGLTDTFEWESSHATCVFLALRYIRSGPFRSLIVVMGLGAVLFSPIVQLWPRSGS